MTEEDGKRYFVSDKNVEEMNRLLTQGELLTLKMQKGYIPELPDLGAAGVKRVLDIACGPGEWVMGLAHQHPEIEVVGMDISKTMIGFAKARAHHQRLKNAAFEVGDATKFPMPGYADGSFDVVNARLTYAFLVRPLWLQLIEECARIARPGGYVRLTNEDARLTTNSPAMAEYHRLGCLAFYRAGKGFYQDQIGSIPHTPEWFARAGLRLLDQTHYIYDISMGTEGYQVAYEDYKVLLKLLRSFLVRYDVISKPEVDDLYERCVQEMQHGIVREDGTRAPYTAYWHFATFFGQKPEIA